MSLPNLTSGEDIAVVNTSAFERLYWPILDKEGISNIRVANKENDTSQSSRASFTNHPVALEPATVTNASKIFITAECLACKEGEWNDGFEGQPEGVERLEDSWEYFVIETADGSPVLVRDVVAQVHAWAANPFIGDKIHEGMVWMYNASFQRGEDGWCSIGVGCEDDVDEVPEGTKIFFEHFFEHGPDQDTGVPVVSIEFWVEGWMGNSAEYFWKSRGDPELQYGLHHWHDSQGMVCAYPNGDRCLASFQMETIIACVESVLTYLVGPPPQRPVTQYMMPPNNVYGVPTPSEASTAPDDTETWYCDFWEKACAVPHKDGNNIVIYEPKETGIPDPRARPEWASKRLRKAYELLGEGHPRIVRCISLLDSDAGNGVIVERLNPGPHWGDLPVMTTPVQETPSREDKIMLALYYRWALQALNVWLRSDFSLAITGFISVEGPELDADALRDAWKQSKRDERQERNYQAFVAGRTQEPEPSDEESSKDSEEIPEGFSESWSEGEWAGDGNALFYDDYFNITYPREGGYHRKPLFYWASFVWELMTNGLTAEAPWKRDIDWSPFSSPEGRPTEEAADWRDRLQVLEQARLGSVLLKAWKGEYESAEQAAEDIRKIAEEVGINVVNSTVEVGDDWMKLFKDEIDIGEPWENIFELDEAQKKWGTRTLRFKRKTTHVNLPTIEESGLAGP